MKHFLCSVGVSVLLAGPIAAIEQAPRLETSGSTAQDLGMSVLAATANVVYFPLRLAVTTITAGVGGFVGLMTGGDQEAACAVWKSTDGQVFLNPRILEGRERLRFGHRTYATCASAPSWDTDLYYY